MNFIKNPNLPENSVKYVLCSELVEEEGIVALKQLGVNVIYVPKNPKISSPVASHPDINCLHYDYNNFISIDGYCEKFEEYLGTIRDSNICEKFNNTIVPEKISGVYPLDVPLNVVIIGNYVICNPKTISTVLAKLIVADGKTIIPVNQGYSKCSTIVVNANAIITDDISIYKSCAKLFDVLLVEHDNIILNGYDYGFIGGTCGKVNSNKIAFFGDVSTHKNAKEIKSFCKRHYVECISLFGGTLRDYGGITPLIEN